MKHVYILLVNLTFVLGNFEFVRLSSGTQVWYISDNVSPPSKVSLQSENDLYFMKTHVYIILRIFTVPVVMPDYLMGTESEYINTPGASIHYYVGLESNLETRKAAVTYVVKLLQTVLPTIANVKIFRESSKFQSTIFKDMFPQFTRTTMDFFKTALFEITYDGSLRFKMVSPTFESLKTNKVYVCFKYLVLFTFSKETESNETTDIVKIKQAAGINIASIIIHNYKNVQGHILLGQTSTNPLVTQFFGFLGNNEKRIEDIKNEYSFNYITHKITNVMKKRNQIHEFHENGDIVTHTRKLNSYEIMPSKCYIFENSEVLKGYVHIGQECNTKQIEAVLNKAEELSTKKFTVLVVQKEILPVYFILLFRDIVDILGNEYNNSEEIINKIATMLKLRP